MQDTVNGIYLHSYVVNLWLHSEHELMFEAEQIVSPEKDIKWLSPSGRLQHVAETKCRELVVELRRSQETA